LGASTKRNGRINFKEAVRTTSSQFFLAEERQNWSLELHWFYAGMGRNLSLGWHDKVRGKVPRNGSHARFVLQILVDEGCFGSVHIDLSHDLEVDALLLGKVLDLVGRIGLLLAWSVVFGYNVSIFCDGTLVVLPTKLIARKGQNVNSFSLDMTP
jgi:hypothetical protein